MHGAGAPPDGTAAAAARITRVVGREFSGRSELSLDPDLRVYLGDLVRPYGIALREDLLERGEGHAYGEMAEALIRVAVPEDEPVDLLILAYAVPDVQPGRSTALYLSHVCPGGPLAFAVCDQGIAAPYTAARLACEYMRSGDSMRALVVVVEQATLHYEVAAEPEAPLALPDRHTGVALLCDGSGAAALSSVREHAGIAPTEVRELLGAQLAELSALAGDRERQVLVLGGGLSSADADGLEAGRIVMAPAGRPCTGVWYELARRYPEWTEQGSFITLADYDRRRRTLCLCAVDAQPAPVRALSRSGGARAR
jgi:hypothetical protein